MRVFCYYWTMSKEKIIPFAWGLSALALVLSVVAWLQSLLVPLREVTTYDIFPLFGILAFSLMWTHYIIAALSKYARFDKSRLKTHFTVTSLIVLFSLLLHPGLLMWQLWRDGLGLPVDYVAPDLRLFVIIGQIAWLMFIAYEFYRLYADRPWWHYVERASDIAMILVFIHGYALGKDLFPAWFTVVWITYGVTFLIAITYTTVLRYQATRKVL